MEGVGPKNPTYMIIGRSPGKEDDQIGSPMTGANGRLLRELLREAGIQYNDCFFTNTLRCCPFDTSIKERQWAACQDYLLKEIEAANPQVLIAAGAQAMTWLTGQTGLRKLRRRGLPCALPGHERRLVFPIEQPVSLFRARGPEQTSMRNEMVGDLQWIREQNQSGNIHLGGDIPTDYQVAMTRESADRILDEVEAQDILACDLETGTTEWEPALFPYSNGRVVAVGFSWGAGIGRAIPLYARGTTSFLLWDDETYAHLVQRLTKIFQQKKVFGHNFLSFDQKWVRSLFGVEYCHTDFDTMLAHYLLDEERGTHGLERLALVYTTMPPWKAMFSLADTTSLCQYLCRDVDATWRLRQVFESMLTPKFRWLLNDLLLPLSDVLVDVEYKGVRVAGDALDKLNKVLKQKIGGLTGKIRSRQHIRLWESANNQEFNPGSSQQLSDVMENYMRLKCIKRTGSGAYSTDKEVLSHYSSKPLIADIQMWRGLGKLHATYVEQMRRELGEDGHAHTSYKPHGTTTGRLASASPNLQNLPREDTVKKVLDDGSLIKAMFVPDEGHCFLQADYSQIELRILACLSCDPAFLKIFHDGLDAHAAVAAEVYKIPIDEVTKAQRTSAKGLNFGIPYGMGEDTLIQRFVAAGNTEAGARAFLADHKTTFPGVWNYMAQQERLIRTQKYQETPLGRRRRYTEITPEAVRQAYNFPIQSVASDLTLLSIIRIHHALLRMNLPARIVLTVYDSIILSVQMDRFWQVARVVKHLMESLAFPWLTVPIKADLEAGMDWGHLKKVDLEKQSFKSDI
jgi:DNA polymerase-1